MFAFELHVNGEKRYTAGIAEDGQLDAVVSRTYISENHKAPAYEEVYTNVRAAQRQPAKGGYESMAWPAIALKVGDEVTIRVVEASEPAPPESRRTIPIAKKT